MRLYDIDDGYKKYLEDKKNLTLREKIIDKLEDIQIWYNHLFIFDILYNIKQGIKNFWNYRNVIWKDRWYDYSYILKLLEFKLRDTIKNWDCAHYIGSNFTKLRMQVILNRIEEYSVNLENLGELLYQKKISREEYNKQKDELLNKTWKTLGRNITRFWD